METHRQITDKQKKVLSYICSITSKQGRPPTIREIAAWFGFKSTGTVRDYLRALQKKGYLKLTPKKSRAIELAQTKAFKIPVLGRITAGAPDLACETADEYIELDNFLSTPEKQIFALRIKGESMIEKGILDNDLVLVRKQATAHDGDIIAALLDNNEATIKILRRNHHQPYLEAANRAFAPIRKEFTIIGKIIAVMRNL